MQMEQIVCSSARIGNMGLHILGAALICLLLAGACGEKGEPAKIKVGYTNVAGAGESGARTLDSHYRMEMPGGLPSLYYASSRGWAQDNTPITQGFRAALDEAIRKEPIKARVIIERNMKLPDDAVAGLIIRRLQTDISVRDVHYWIDVLRSQGVMRITRRGPLCAQVS